MLPDARSRDHPVIIRFLLSLHPIAAVVTHTREPDEHVVLLANDALYSVCRLHPSRRVATAPNYHVESEHGVLSSALSKSGLLDLLHWTDRETALLRFQRLSYPHHAERPEVMGLMLVTSDRDKP